MDTSKDTQRRYFVVSDDTGEMTAQDLAALITRHKAVTQAVYMPLRNAYMTEYEIFRQPPKPAYKPDNRLAVNFARYITDTFSGYFAGTPVKYVTDDKAAAEYIQYIDRYNGLDSIDADLATTCDIYGHAYEIYYVDEAGQIGVSVVPPTDGFMVYDESIRQRPRYFVRYYTGADGITRGSISDAVKVRYFEIRAGLRFTDSRPHGFDGVPATEYTENSARRGIFEPVMSLINAYNAAISQKANDIEYFADAYLKVLGAKLEREDLDYIRDNRIINLDGDYEGNAITVDFIEKPDGDASQEHFLDRLEKLIYQIAMVANISDEQFATSSGIALKYKLLAMSNLAAAKERIFAAAYDRRFRLIFSNPVNQLPAGAWVSISYNFTRSLPTNLLDEAQTAALLAGTVSTETRLGVLSIVDDVAAEKKRIQAEHDTYMTDYPTDRLGGDDE